MHVEVRVAVADPTAIDTAAIAAEIPYGTVIVTPVAGGLDIESPRGDDDALVIANAAILVSFEE